MNRLVKLLVSSTTAFIAYIAATWFGLGALTHDSRTRWILFLIFVVIGLVIVTAIVWYVWHRPPPVTSDDDELAQLFAMAARQMPKTGGARRESLRSHRAMLLLGPAKSGKTMVVARSPLDKGVIAGEVFGADPAVPIPTSLGVIWYNERSLIVEAGWSFAQSADRWPQFFKHLLPTRGFRALFTGDQAARVAVVCVSCADLMRENSDETLTALANTLRSALTTMASSLGSRLPVYVLFTKADEVTGFTEAVAGLGAEGMHALVGARFPIESGDPSGPYVERQSQRLVQRFERLYESFALDRTLTISPRNEPVRRALAYEFARVFSRKLTTPAISFLTTLCKPNPPQPSAFLRAFYFVGLRRVVDEPETDEGYITEPQFTAEPGFSGAVGATEALGGDDGIGAVGGYDAPLPAGGGKARWAFLDQVLSEILNDEAAFLLTTRGRRVNVVRRAALGTAAAVAALLLVVTTWSFAANLALERRVDHAMRAVALPAGDSVRLTGGMLRRLDTLRMAIESLSPDTGDEPRPPLSWRWGLYTGARMLDPARRAYFATFDRLILAATRVGLERQLDSLAMTPSTAGRYSQTYRVLKAYLSVTEHAEKSTDSIAPVLMTAWRSGRPMTPEDSAVAEAQFAYTASTLAEFNPFPAKPLSPVVETARNFVNQFGSDQLYALIGADIARNTKPVSFGADAQHGVFDPYEVSGAFTVDGWKKMQAALGRVVMYSERDQWVTGVRTITHEQRDSLAAQVRRLYVADYNAHWRMYLGSARIDAGRNLKEASARLQTLASNESSLLRLLALASHNTNVDTAVSNHFVPVQAVIPPTAGDVLIGATNQAYVNALLALGSAAGLAAEAKLDTDPLVRGAQDAATKVVNAVGELSQKFPADTVGRVDHIVSALLTSPAESVIGLVRHAGNLAEQAAALCQAYKTIADRYPFDSTGLDLPIEDFSAMFRPGQGRLARFINEHGGEGFDLQRGTYVRRADARVSQGFVDFINKMTRISTTMYADARSDPSFSLDMTGVFDSRVTAATLTVDDADARWWAPQQMRTVTWRGNAARRARLDAIYTKGSKETIGPFDGPWALLRIFGQAKNKRRELTADTYQWEVAAFRVESTPGKAVVGRELFTKLECAP